MSDADKTELEKSSQVSGDKSAKAEHRIQMLDLNKENVQESATAVDKNEKVSMKSEQNVWYVYDG